MLWPGDTFSHNRQARAIILPNHKMARQCNPTTFLEDIEPEIMVTNTVTTIGGD